MEVHKETHQAAHRLLLLRLLEMRELAAIFAQAVAVAQRIESERIDAAATKEGSRNFGFMPSLSTMKADGGGLSMALLRPFLWHLLVLFIM